MRGAREFEALADVAEAVSREAPDDAKTRRLYAQALIGIEWQGLACKDDFMARQASDPILLSMGRPEQRARVAADE